MAAPKVTGSASKVYTVYDFEIEDESLIPMVYRPVDMAAILRAAFKVDPKDVPKAPAVPK